MKILQTKLSNTAAYLLLVFAVASAGLFLYGQFSNLEFETINNTDSEVSPVVDNIEPDVIVGGSGSLLEDETVSTPELESDMMAPESPVVE
jgi:hypothetical protein